MDQNNQTLLQPDLVNQIHNKVTFLNQFESAIINNQLYEIYSLVRENNAELQEKVQSLPLIVSDLQPLISRYLAPNLIRFVQKTLPFLFVEPLNNDFDNYAVFIGDWWNHREIGTLNVISSVMSVDEKIINELKITEQLPSGETINDDKIQEINKNIEGLQEFLSDNTKRKLELQVIEDQLEELKTNKSGLFGRNDKSTKESLEKKQELLQATQKRVPDVEKKLGVHEAELLALEKENALRQLELQSIVAEFNSIEDFVGQINRLPDSYLKSLK